MKHIIITLWIAIGAISVSYFYTGGKDAGWVGSILFIGGIITVILTNKRSL